MQQHSNSEIGIDTFSSSHELCHVIYPMPHEAFHFPREEIIVTVSAHLFHQDVLYTEFYPSGEFFFFLTLC